LAMDILRGVESALNGKERNGPSCSFMEIT